MPADPMELAAPEQCVSLTIGESVAYRGRLEDEVTALFDQFRDRLLRYLLSFGLPVEDAEEILQEIFLSLFRQFLGRKPCDHPRGWLFRVAHNLALRRRERNRRPEEGLANELAGEGPADPAPGPEEQLIFRQTQRRLLAVWQVLPEQDRHCLTLRAEGVRYREIAQILGMSLGAVSQSLTRSLARLARSANR